MTADDLVGGPPERCRRLTVARTRWQVVGIAVVAAVGLAIVAPPLSLHADLPAGTPTRSPNPPQGEALGVAAVRWPLRGDLAKDDVFVEGALRRLQQDRPSATRPLFAGRLPNGSRLLLASSDVNPGAVATTVSAVHIAARHSFVTGRVSQVAALTDPAQVLGWATAGREGNVYALALGPPRTLRLQVSTHVEFDRGGFPSRRWRRLVSSQGAVLVDLGARTDPGIAVRSLDQATFVDPVLIPVAGRRVTSPGAVQVAGLADPGYRGPRPGLLQQGLVAGTSNLLDLGDTVQRVIWSGKPTHQRRFALVLVTRQDGLRFQALVGEQYGGWFPAGLRALPADAPDRLPWLLEPFSSNDPTQLLCPTGPGSMDYDRGGLPTSRVPINEQGVATLLSPSSSLVRAGGAQVRVRDASGQVVLTATLPMSGFDDPLAINPR